jgi:hypothetical protein
MALDDLIDRIDHAHDFARDTGLFAQFARGGGGEFLAPGDPAPGRNPNALERMFTALDEQNGPPLETSNGH